MDIRLMSKEDAVQFRDDMMFLWGQLEALGFLVDPKGGDLWESITVQYKRLTDKVLDLNADDSAKESYDN